MDIEEANKFINSLVKNLQVLCHGHVNFNNSIQVIGHLYLNVDSQTNIDYIVNEKVCKDDNSSTMFVSNSYHSEPKAKVNKNKETQQAPDKSDESSSGHFNIANNRSNSHHQHNLNQTKDMFGPNRKKRTRPEKQYIIHPPKVFKPIVNESSPLQQSIVGSPKNDFVDNDRNVLHNSKQPSTSSTNSPYHTESASQSVIHNSESDADAEESKPFQVIPPIDLELDLSRVKAEPIDPCDDEGTASFTSVTGTTDGSTSNNNNNDNNCDNSVLADDMCSEDYLIGLRDKTLGLYPSSLQQSSDLAHSSSFNLASSSTAAVGSSSFYNSKNSPVTNVVDDMKFEAGPVQWFIPTNRGGRFLCYDGYMYGVNKKTENIKTKTWRINWKCTTKNCSRYLTTINDVVCFDSLKVHNHPPNLCIKPSGEIVIKTK